MKLCRICCLHKISALLQRRKFMFLLLFCFVFNFLQMATLNWQQTLSCNAPPNASFERHGDEEQFCLKRNIRTRTFGLPAPLLCFIKKPRCCYNSESSSSPQVWHLLDSALLWNCTLPGHGGRQENTFCFPGALRGTRQSPPDRTQPISPLPPRSPAKSRQQLE